MAEFGSHGELEQGKSSVDAEISGLIANIVARKQPAESVLRQRETETEQIARAKARQEINDIARQIKYDAAARAASEAERQSAPMIVKGVNPFAPPSEPALADPAALEAYQDPFIGVPEPQIDDDYTAPVITPMVAPDDTLPIAVAAGAGGGGEWFGHSPDGLPIWLSAGVPVAAVSLFALGIAAAGGLDAPEALLASEAATSGAIVATAPEASPFETTTFPKLTLASAPASIGEQSFSIDPIPAVQKSAIEMASSGAINPAPYLTREISQNVPVAGGAGGSSIVFAGRTAKEEIEAPLASAPSVKPSVPRAAPRAVESKPSVSSPPSARATASPLKPRRAMPARMFSGRMDPGSAAQIVNGLAQQSGPALTRTEQFWLARDAERVFENELDGRSVSLKSRQGQRVRVTLKKSAQIQREFTLARAAEIADLPHNMVLEGGWYAARRDVTLHASAVLGTGLKHRVLKHGEMIERMATYTDRYGSRWYLMGQRGLAVGFLSPADVTLAGAYKGILGNPYAASQGQRVHETRTVYTTCRESFVGPEGGLVQRLNVCRDGNGHWVAYDEGKLSTRQASLAGPFLPQANTASAIVLAEATGDPVAYHAFGNRRFRRRFQGNLATARFAQTTEQVLPNGDPIKFTFGETYQHEALAPLKRVEALMPVSGKLRVDAGWMKASIGASLRASPDYLAQSLGSDIPAGRAIETMGHVAGVRGGEDWVLVGRSGVAFGYVPAHKLTEIEGRVSPHAFANVRGAAVADLVTTVSTCRIVNYETIEGTGQFDACQQADSSWALKTEPETTRQFVQSEGALKAAP